MASAAIGEEPDVVPIRGGTDGAMLTFKGLPCPNLPTGSHNVHGLMEYVSVPELEKVAQLIIEVAKAR